MAFYKYTPALTEPEVLQKTLVGRKNELDTLSRIVSNALSGGSISHAILVGPKGIGKSHLLRIIYHAIKGDVSLKGFNAFKSKVIPVITPEEEYLSDITKFLNNIVNYIKEYDTAELSIPLLNANQVSLEKERELLLSYLKTFKKKTGKMLLLLIDNLNEIIENFTDEDQSSFRELLMTSKSMILIGSAPTLFDSIVQHDKPLYNFFEIIWLEDLSFDETLELFKKYAETEKREDVIEKLNQSNPKLRAIYELAGGNPRLILSLYQMIVENEITHIEEMFLRMLDELSPYFNQKMKDVAPQQREIIDAMARSSGLLTPTEIATQCRLSVNLVNSQLKRLERAGYVKSISHRRKKRALYDIKEKLFGIWRQMRVEAGRKRLGFIVSFYQIWFTKTELRDMLVSLIREIGDKTNAAKEKVIPALDRLWYIKEAIADSEISSIVDIMNIAYSSEDTEDKIKRLQPSLEIAVKTSKKILDSNSNLSEESKGIVWSFLGDVYNVQEKYEDAIYSYIKAFEFIPQNYLIWKGIGVAYYSLSKYEDAIQACKKALALKSDDVLTDVLTLELLGNAYAKLEKQNDAIEAYRKAVELMPDENGIWFKLGRSYWSLEKLDEAMEAFQKAREDNPTDEYGRFRQGMIDLLLMAGSLLANKEEDVLLYLKSFLEHYPHYFKKMEESLGLLIIALKALLENGNIDMIKRVLKEIELSGKTEVLEFVSPYTTLIQYLDTNDSEIIERLREEERKIVEEMLKVFQKSKKEKVKGPANKKS